MSAQQSGLLRTPNTNDLDWFSSDRAIIPVPKAGSNPDPYYVNPSDRRYRENRGFRQVEYDEHGRDQTKHKPESYVDPSEDRNSRIRSTPYPQNEPRGNSYESDDRVERERAMQPRKYSPDNQTNTQPEVVRTANSYPSTVERNSRELINSSTRFGEMRGGATDDFSSNRVVPFGSAGKQDISTQLPNTPDLSPTYKEYLPFVRICGLVVVQANFPLADVELQLLEIENLQRDLGNYLGLPAPREKIELCLFRDEATYMKFLVTRFSNAPRDRRALYIKKNGSAGVVMVQRLKDFEIDLRHEMTHAIVHASIPVVPIWLDEGLAKYFEQLPQDRFNDNPYLKQVRRNMKFGAFAVPSLSRLEKLAIASDMGDSEYRDSWAWVHFMFHHSERSHRMLAGYLKLLASLPQDKYKDKNGTVKVPNLSLYMEDHVENPRQQFRKHFQK
ncbi:MAG: DUF1570 domain-containing protein [Planctomycetaceae bacterium]|nr:DUF1570 domain-containing protein [Planctomycetaceae bacterium]